MDVWARKVLEGAKKRLMGHPGGVWRTAMMSKLEMTAACSKGVAEGGSEWERSPSCVFILSVFRETERSGIER